MAYLTTEVSEVEHIDEQAWDRCIEASWSALEENFPWEGVSEHGFDVDTKQKKKDYLIAERNKRIESPFTLVQEWYDDNGYLVFYTWGDIDRDAMDGRGRMSIQFIAYGPDENGRRQYIARDQLKIKRSSRKFMRAQGVQHMDFWIANEDNSMHRHVNRYFVNHSPDTRESEIKENTWRDTRINKYKLSDNVEDDELLD